MAVVAEGASGTFFDQFGKLRYDLSLEFSMAAAKGLGDKRQIPSALLVGASPDWNQAQLTWKEATDFPSNLLRCETLILLPEPFTKDAQIAILKYLRDAVPAQARPRVFWIINRFSIDEAGDLLNVGRLYELPPGDISVAPSAGARPEPEFIAYGVMLKSHSQPITVGTLPGRRLAILAAGDVRGDVFLLPEVRPLTSYLAMRFRRSIALLVCAVLIFVLGVSARVLIPPRRDSAQKNLVESTKRFRDFELSFEDSVEKSRRPPHMLVSGLLGRMSDDFNAKKDISVPLLAGDLRGTYLQGKQDPSETATIQDVLWSSAILYLQELDFGTSRSFLYMFLDLSRSYHSTFNITEWFTREQERTLAQVLKREFESGRIFSLCQDENSDAFDWAVGVSDDEPQVDVARRKKNANTFCPRWSSNPNRPKAPDYRELAVLQRLRTGKLVTKSRPKICDVADIECLYLDRMSSLTGDPKASSIAAALQFASSRCSYLSDDAVANVLYAAKEEKTIRTQELVKALACADRLRGDFNRIISDLIGQMECSYLTGEPSKVVGVAGSLVDDLRKRCFP
jgi:hypothetical protein